MEKQSYAVGWLTLSLIIAGIAQGNNRSGFGWWIAALIFGPFALFVLVLCGKNHNY